MIQPSQYEGIYALTLLAFYVCGFFFLSKLRRDRWLRYEQRQPEQIVQKREYLN